MSTLQAISEFSVGFLARLWLIVLVPVVLSLLATAVVAVVQLTRAAKRRAQGLEMAGGLRFKADLYYAPGHMWLSKEGGDDLRIGLDDLAIRLLHSPTLIELPRKGQLLQKGEVAAVVLSDTRRVEIAAPLAGRVGAVNPRLFRGPNLLLDAYNKGWLFELSPEAPDFTDLKHGEEARDWIGAEGLRFAGFMEHQLGIASADGGELLHPAGSMLSDDQWRLAVESFLK